MDQSERTAVDSCDVEIRVRYAETDQFGYLHHAKYAEYMEIGRTELLRVNGARYKDLEADGVFFVVAKMEIKFIRPAGYDDVLTVRTFVKHATRVRIEHGYEIRRDRQLLATASTTIVCVGRDGRPMGMPEGLLPEMKMSE